jgi:hypothetical protein
MPPIPASSGKANRPFPQISEIELATRLEPEDEEEERHQAAVHPLAQFQRDAGAGEVDRQSRFPERLVRRSVDVHPHQCRDGRSQQDRRPARFGAQKLAQRRLHISRPRRPSRERWCLGLGWHGVAGRRYCS